jgi:hypothetical protein
MSFPAQYLHQALIGVAVKMRAARLQGSQDFFSQIQQRMYANVRTVAVESPSLKRFLELRRGNERTIDDWIGALADRHARVRLARGVYKRPLLQLIRETFSGRPLVVRPRLRWGTRIEIGGNPIGLLSEWTMLPRSAESSGSAAVEWRIAYEEARFDFRDEVCTPREASQGLCLALQRTERLCVWRGWRKFREIFVGAQQTLLGKSAFTPHAGELLDPRLFSDEVRRLFEAANAAWVFGGMGTFADMRVDEGEERAEYANCQSDLLATIDRGIITAVNFE